MKILIVDDNEVFTRSLATVLKTQGHDSTICFTLAEASELERTKHPPGFDAVFVDLVMPGSSPMGLADFIAQVRLRRETTAIIIVTGQFGDDDWMKPFREMVDEVCQKTKLTPSEVARVLERAVLKASHEPRLEAISRAHAAFAILSRNPPVSISMPLFA